MLLIYNANKYQSNLYKFDVLISENVCYIIITFFTI